MLYWSAEESGEVIGHKIGDIVDEAAKKAEELGETIANAVKEAVESAVKTVEKVAQEVVQTVVTVGGGFHVNAAKYLQVAMLYYLGDPGRFREIRDAEGFATGTIKDLLQFLSSPLPSLASFPAKITVDAIDSALIPLENVVDIVIRII
ncbi:hypothetical protein TWF718_000462 [Orbilia javanica]|uniref:Uncharacterized protein n=1 Tax=Orbilia javanica TaxID=47235 RepID=A0AAN8MZR3_9PEZI